MNVAEQHPQLRGRLLTNEPLLKYTSWRVGGPAERLYKPADRDDLQLFMQQLSSTEPLTFIGLGSNLLIRDGGISGTVIVTQNAVNRLEIHHESQTSVTVYAETGVSCAQLARFSVKHALTGGEFFAGIPGTVGGALAMNAGAFGSETWQFIEQVETLSRAGETLMRSAVDYEIGYRSVKGCSQEWFLAGYFRFTHDPAADGEERIKALLNKRGATQPIGVYSCGSVFRNPPGDHAARLIESVGLKSYRIGGAMVSEKHANFIINDADASAADIEQLIYHVQAEVEAKTGIRLQPEVRVVGDSE